MTKAETVAVVVYPSGADADTLTVSDAMQQVLRARLSEREVKCVLRPEIAAKIGSSHDWNEAWAEQGVLVRGRLYYNSYGDLVKVDAEDIEEIRTEPLSIADFRDEQYVPGASPVEFLDDAWGEPNA